MEEDLRLGIHSGGKRRARQVRLIFGHRIWWTIALLISVAFWAAGIALLLGWRP
jgi:hypothetical protein